MRKWIHDTLRERLLQRKGLVEPQPLLTLKELEDSVKQESWDETFLTLMFNRLLIGRLRYGPKRKGTHNHVKAIKTKIELYENTGNTEYLVDVGNYCMLEFRYGVHPNKHFSSTDDEDHCEKL